MRTTWLQLRRLLRRRKLTYRNSFLRTGTRPCRVCVRRSFPPMRSRGAPSRQVRRNLLISSPVWLDNTCSDRYDKPYLDCSPEQQKEILDKIAYRKNAAADSSLSQGVEFFSFLRNMTADGFFTSEIGIKYLGYIGSTYLTEFPGCPPVSEA
ncbi:MAG: hypothetical protein DMG94_09620 [Acidobacteria bacterium]|nr:MAG: hypothetical protein DMG94_09620 [Acidobacteriota bacterium]